MRSVTFPDAIPNFNEPPFRGTYQQLLYFNIGHCVTVESLAGSGVMLTVTGMIEDVGSQYVLLRQESGKVITADMYGIKRITFH